MSPSDSNNLNRVIVRLAMTVQTGIDYLSGLPVTELLDVIKEVAEIGDERKRVQAGNTHSRKY